MERPERTVADEHPARREHPNIFGYGRARDRINDDIDTTVRSKLSDALPDVLNLSVDHMVSAETTDERRAALANSSDLLTGNRASDRNVIVAAGRMHVEV